MNKVRFWEATATLVGGIIGAGILGLPYALSHLGFFGGGFLLLILGLSEMSVNLMFAEIILRTKYRHQIVGYTEKYLGKWAKYFEIIAMTAGSYGVLVVYIIGEGVILSALLGGDRYFYSLIFLTVGAFILYFGVNTIKVFELWMVVFFITIILAILGISHGYINIENYNGFDITGLPAAYGVILFAYGGTAAVATLRQVLKDNEKYIEKAVIIGTMIPIIIYVLFTFVIIGVMGKSITEIATVGLGLKFGVYMIVLGNLFAFFTMGTGFLSAGNILRSMFMFDFKISKIYSWLLAILVPLLLFVWGVRGFIDTLSIVGGVTTGLTSIIIILNHRQAIKKGDRVPEFAFPKIRILRIALIAVFILGFVFTIFNVLFK